MKLKVVKADGNNFVKNEKVGPVNLFLQSLFSSSEVTLQNKTSVTCNNNPYTAIIKSLLNLDHSTTTTQATTQLFISDDFDHPEDANPAGKNNGLFLRLAFIAESSVGFTRAIVS